MEDRSTAANSKETFYPKTDQIKQNETTRDVDDCYDEIKLLSKEAISMEQKDEM